MSLTATQTQTATVEAIFRYEQPDLSVTAAQRSLFAKAKPLHVQEEQLPLYDYRTDTKLSRGVEGLHKHGFTLVEHHIDASAWDTDDAVRNKYVPSVEQLVKNITGCKTVIVNNVAFRRKLPKQYDSAKDFYHPAGGDLDKQIAALPHDRIMVAPKQADKSLEPARGVHVDYTTKGLLDTVRSCHPDMAAAGHEALKAHDAGERPPRVAAYSVWRPLKTVKRDPIAVLNWTSPGDITKDLHPFDYRSRGHNGEYLLEAYMITKPEKPDDHQWYYVSEQQPHEVLLFKFADTESAFDENVALACGHGSPFVLGTEDEEPRESVEARVLTFW